MVLSSRTDPPFPVARLRGRGQLLELDAGLLRFSVPETRTLLRKEMEEFFFGENAQLPEGWAPPGSAPTKGGAAPTKGGGAPARK